MYHYDLTDVTSAPIYISEVQCHGQEEKLTDCSYTNYETDTDPYGHHDDIGVTCYPIDGKNEGLFFCVCFIVPYMTLLQ